MRHPPENLRTHLCLAAPPRWFTTLKRTLLALATTVVAPALWAATITVNSTADTAANDGLCTLREAIIAANNNAASGGLVGECAAGSGADVIAFNIAGGGTLLISPATPLPTILSQIRINGYTQPGSSANSNGPLLGSNAKIRIEIDNGAIANAPTLLLLGGGAAGSIIEGLALSRNTYSSNAANNAIQIQDTSNVWVRGNFFGTDATGLTLKEQHARSVFITGSTTGIIVGSNTSALTPAYRNVINRGAVEADNAANLTIRGNLIGTKPDGNTVFAGGLTDYGVYVTTLSGTSLVSDNVVAATLDTIFVGGGSNGVVIERNVLGLGVDGVTLLPAGLFAGIVVLGNTDPSTNVTIRFNTLTNLKGSGVIVEKNAPTDVIRGVVISQNVIYNTADIGIDLSNSSSADGITPNDPLDTDQGANNLQNYPVLSAATNTADIISVPYTLNSEVSSSYVVEFFQTTTCHSSGFGGGQVYLGAAIANTNPSGNAGATPTFASTLTSGFITAVAMNFINGSSEFSACVPLTGPAGNVLLSVSKTGTGAGAVTGTGINCGADCSESVPLATVVALTATPTAGSTFAGWSGGGCSGTSSCNVTVNAATAVNAQFDLISPPVTLSVTLSGSGAGSVTGTGINCGLDCSEPVAPGTTVVLTATATAGSSFVGWSGGCTGTAACSVTVNAATSVNAQFDANPFTVTKSGSGSGIVTGTGINCGADCSEPYAPGELVTLTATAAPGSTFIGWSGGTCTGTSTCVFTMPVGGVTVPVLPKVNAQFDVVVVPTFLLTVTKSGAGTGAVTGTGIACGADCTETLAQNTVVVLTAGATAGSTFAGWTGAGCSGTATCSFTMSAAQTVNAQFDVIVVPTFVLTVTKSGTGTGTVTGTGITCGVDCTETLAQNMMVTLTASPLAGSNFAGWTGGGCAGTGTCIVTMTAALTVNAQFDATLPPATAVVPVPTLHPALLALLAAMMLITAGAMRRTL